MPRWNTNKIMSDLRTLDCVDSVTSVDQGGCYATDTLIIETKSGGSFQMYAMMPRFECHDPIDCPSDTEQASHLFLSDGVYQDVAVISDDPEMHRAYADIYTFMCGQGWKHIYVHWKQCW